MTYSRLYPELYGDKCKWCSARSTLQHIPWECSVQNSNIPQSFVIKTSEQCETVLLSSKRSVAAAEDAAKAHGLLKKEGLTKAPTQGSRAI